MKTDMSGHPTEKRRPASLALRVTILVGITTTLVFMAFNWVIVRSLEMHFAEQDTTELQAVAGAVVKTLAEVPHQEGNDSAMVKQLSAIAIGRHGVTYSVYTKSGSPVYISHGADLSLLLKRDKFDSIISDDDVIIWQDQGRSYRGAALEVGAESTPGGTPFIVAIAMDIDFHLEFLTMFKTILWWATLIVSVIALIVAWCAVQWGHRPIRKVSRDIRAIRSSRLDVRLDPTEVPIELEELAASFNDMLGRIEDGFAKLANFSADIAHELRTPVTNLVMQTEVALSQSRSSAEYREILYSNLEEFERMSRMISDMLFLAQTENDPHNLHLSDISIAAMIQDLFDYFEALAEETNITLTLQGHAEPVKADREMMLRALSNLISNAIQYSAPGSTVIVRLSQDKQETTVSVENPSEQIVKEDLPKLFDRFFRTDPSRKRKTSGAGLGLAIVKSIVEAHGGTVQATSEQARVKFEVVLPHIQEG